MAQLDLQCPSGCTEGLFELLNGRVLVDRTGRYVRHESGVATFVCATCQSVAVDLAAAAREMRDVATLVLATIECPSCGLEMLPPEDDSFALELECPACEVRFSLDEGTRRLHGGDAGDQAAI